MSLFLTGGVAFLVGRLVVGDRLGAKEERLREFVEARIERVWQEPEERQILAEEIARGLGVSLELYDAGGAELLRVGPGCPHDGRELSVGRDAANSDLGTVVFCNPARKAHRIGLFALLFLATFLWLTAGYIAHRLIRPLRELTGVATRIGEGELRVRAGLARHRLDEVGDLARAVNEMATRIEKQLREQRELLAGVSHEIRTPLGRLRVLCELLEDHEVGAKRRAQIEHEVLEIDRLVAELLASSRLEFIEGERVRLDARQVAELALERAGLPAGVLDVEGTRLGFDGDPTLLARALSNLLGNAKQHGGGVERLCVRAEAEGPIWFLVEDGGPGLNEEEQGKLFDPFFRGRGYFDNRDLGATGSLSLGLGLSLVARIARAHGGHTVAENRAPLGARVGFSVHAAE